MGAKHCAVIAVGWLWWVQALMAEDVVEGEEGVVVAEEEGAESLFRMLDYLLLAGIGGIGAWYLFIRVSITC